MKKIISLILVAVFILSAISLTACGSINSTEVSILWRGDGSVKVPDSLINCLERAMYIENISYKHYGADGNSASQLDQAKEVAEKGCSALVIELVDTTMAAEFVAIAKDKDIPVVFIGDVAESVLASYEKCVAINSNTDTLAKIRGKQIGEYVSENLKALDRNNDGKISYVHFTNGDSEELITEINSVVKDVLVFYDDKNSFKLLPEFEADKVFSEIMKKYNDEAKNTVELIITDNDTIAREILVVLQENGFNTDQLTTHCIPVFTVGFEEDYKNYVLSGSPQITLDMMIGQGDSVVDIENKLEKLEEAIAKYYESNKYLCDLTTVSEDDVEVMIWNTKNIIASGRLAGTVIEDQDAVAATIAAVVRNFVKGNSAFAGLDAECIEGNKYLVPYIPT